MKPKSGMLSASFSTKCRTRFRRGSPTGLVAVAIGPRANGKTNAGLLMAEQLSAQGWVSVLIDPETELESLYGEAVADPDMLRNALAKRDQPILVVNATDAGEFVPYGRAILDVADQYRKPILVVIDEGPAVHHPRTRGPAEPRRSGGAPRARRSL